MIGAGLNLHRIARIQIRREKPGTADAKWFSILATDVTGEEFEITLYFNEQPEIEGAEFLNFVRAVEQEEA